VKGVKKCPYGNATTAATPSTLHHHPKHVLHAKKDANSWTSPATFRTAGGRRREQLILRSMKKATNPTKSNCAAASSIEPFLQFLSDSQRSLFQKPAFSVSLTMLSIPVRGSCMLPAQYSIFRWVVSFRAAARNLLGIRIN